MPKFYVCYAWPLKQGGEYSVVKAATYQESRRIIDRALGKNNFAMHMGKEFEPLIEAHGLEEVDLEA